MRYWAVVPLQYVMKAHYHCHSFKVSTLLHCSRGSQHVWHSQKTMQFSAQCHAIAIARYINPCACQPKVRERSSQPKYQRGVTFWGGWAGGRVGGWPSVHGGTCIQLVCIQSARTYTPRRGKPMVTCVSRFVIPRDMRHHYIVYIVILQRKTWTHVIM